MICEKPFRKGLAEYGCGQCLPCRLNRRRLWTIRLVLESSLHQASCFVTLTYADENLPVDGSVDPRVAQLFLKRLRERVSPHRIRYFLVGEYGDITCRPHYHAIIFGIEDAEAVEKAWGLGHVMVGSVTPQSAAYCVGYTVKGATRVGDPRLDGRRPEFARMSLRPGIGAGACESIAEVVFTKAGCKFLGETGDVPGVCRYEGAQWPIGRYLRSKVRVLVGMESKAPPRAAAVAEFNRFLELSPAGAVKAREVKRQYVARRARRFVQIANSKKGIGL